MDEIAMHILDIAMNALSAGGQRVTVAVDEDVPGDRLEVSVEDDGRGMNAEQLREVQEHLASGKTSRRRRIGLGLALLRQTAETCGGELQVVSQPGQGTRVRAWMQHGHIDRPPLGDLRETIYTLSIGAPDLDVEFMHRKNGVARHFSSAAVRRELGPGASLQSPEGIRAIRLRLDT